MAPRQRKILPSQKAARVFHHEDHEGVEWRGVEVRRLGSEEVQTDSIEH
jgi:hypothetical protein